MGKGYLWRHIGHSSMYNRLCTRPHHDLEDTQNMKKRTAHHTMPDLWDAGLGATAWWLEGRAYPCTLGGSPQGRGQQ